MAFVYTNALKGNEAYYLPQNKDAPQIDVSSYSGLSHIAWVNTDAFPLSRDSSYLFSQSPAKEKDFIFVSPAFGAKLMEENFYLHIKNKAGEDYLPNESGDYRLSLSGVGDSVSSSRFYVTIAKGKNVFALPESKIGDEVTIYGNGKGLFQSKVKASGSSGSLGVVKISSDVFLKILIEGTGRSLEAKKSSQETLATMDWALCSPLMEGYLTANESLKAIHRSWLAAAFALAAFLALALSVFPYALERNLTRFFVYNGRSKTEASLILSLPDMVIAILFSVLAIGLTSLVETYTNGLVVSLGYGAEGYVSLGGLYSSLAPLSFSAARLTIALAVPALWIAFSLLCFLAHRLASA